MKIMIKHADFDMSDDHDVVDNWLVCSDWTICRHCMPWLLHLLAGFFLASSLIYSLGFLYEIEIHLLAGFFLLHLSFIR